MGILGKLFEKFQKQGVSRSTAININNVSVDQNLEGHNNLDTSEENTRSKGYE